MAAFDFDAAVRWFRFDPKAQLRRRVDADLPFELKHDGTSQGLILDTCVYIDQLRGQLPADVANQIATRLCHHSTVAIQELLFSIGALDPRDKRRPRTIASLRALVQSMRPHRISAPDSDLLGRAAMLSGLLARTQGYAGDRRIRALMDATLFLQSAKLGLKVVTRNIGDFDLLLQLMPKVSVQMYRIPETTGDAPSISTGPARR